MKTVFQPITFKVVIIFLLSVQSFAQIISTPKVNVKETTSSGGSEQKAKPLDMVAPGKQASSGLFSNIFAEADAKSLQIKAVTNLNALESMHKSEKVACAELYENC